jgi:betaine-aldehyde dehydrogenase
MTDVSTSDQIARHWINGQWRDSAEHGISHDDFTTGNETGRSAEGMEAEAAQAVAAARHAFLH